MVLLLSESDDLGDAEGEERILVVNIYNTLRSITFSRWCNLSVYTSVRGAAGGAAAV